MTIKTAEAIHPMNGGVARTPTLHSPMLSKLSDSEVWLKLENLQTTGSFKVRGAQTKLSTLSPEQRKKGVIAASAGNHAQGVAYHAEKLGIPATIVMPKSTPFTKVARTEALGATIVLEGETLSEASDKAHQLERENGLTYIPPYDDPDIIAGQGSVMHEFLEDAPSLDSVIVPIGGGGLISGCALAVKEVGAQTKLFGVQSALFPSMISALEGTTPNIGGQTIAEGIAVKTPGVLTKTIIEKYVQKIFQVDETTLEKAVHLLLIEQKLVVEGAGAAPLAALIKHKETFKGQKVGLVISGGNIDARILSAVLMRGLAREGRLARLRMEVPDAPGSLARATEIIGKRNGNIIEIHHRRLFYDIPVKMTEVDVIIETIDGSQLDDIVTALVQAGFPTVTLKNTSSADPG